jgi:acyl-CoA synthetase (AMP-forming)/AMP-acid ligase II
LSTIILQLNNNIFFEYTYGSNGMDYRWYSVWPSWSPKTLDPEKPVSEYIREWALLTPKATALSFYGLDISYAELNSMIDKTAWGLVSLGLKKGDRVAVHMENCPQFVIAYFAVQRAGGVIVAVNPMFKGAELEFEFNDAGVEILIGIDALYPEVEKIRSNTQLKNVILTSMKDFLPAKPVLPLPDEAKHAKIAFPDTVDFVNLMEKSQDKPICKVTDMKKDLALLQYTGGTTGTPKGAMISHYSLSVASLGTMHWLHLRENDIYLGVTPFFHVMGQTNLMCTPLASGAQIVVLTRFIPEVIAQAITHYRCTYWVGATTMVISLLNLPNIKDYDFSSFRCIWSGGAPISVDLQNKLKEIAPKAVIGEGYGLSEVMSQGGACTPLFRHKPGFVGIPQVNVIMKILDQETGTKEMTTNEPGEIVIKSPAMMLGYWNKPEETKEMLRDGWLYTGDTGSMDEEGYVRFLGRSRELIKCSGFSVFPAEVEDLLYRHPAVKESAVIGVNDPYRGESVKAFIILKDDCAGVKDTEILDWCKDNMAAYKRPRFIEFRKELPKSGAGKLLKRVLVQEEQKKAGAGT